MRHHSPLTTHNPHLIPRLLHLSTTTGVFTLSWKITGDTIKMAIQTSADWAALGISKTGMMIGSDAVIGDVKSATVQQYDLNVSAMHFSENTEQHLLQLKLYACMLLSLLSPSILNALDYSQQLNSSNLVCVSLVLLIPITG